jgi:hypothetical protein
MGLSIRIQLVDILADRRLVLVDIPLAFAGIPLGMVDRRYGSAERRVDSSLAVRIASGTQCAKARYRKQVSGNAERDLVTSDEAGQEGAGCFGYY